MKDTCQCSADAYHLYLFLQRAFWNLASIGCRKSFLNAQNEVQHDILHMGNDIEALICMRSHNEEVSDTSASAKLVANTKADVRYTEMSQIH